MAAKPAHITEPIPGREALIEAFHACARPREDWLVGGEFERHLLTLDGAPLPYFGPYGVKWLLQSLAERGWQPAYEGENVIALQRDRAWVTLEPGSQLELSSTPFADVSALEAQSRAFTAEVDAVFEGLPVRQVALGYTPYADIGDICWVPKGRYAVMREILGNTGELAHHMMKGTCAVQASYDFEDEADCARKVRLGSLLGPLITAMFANSPLTRGKPNGYASFRGHAWTLTDPARTGFPEAAERFSFERWVDYLLDVPMMFLCLEGTWRNAGGTTFRQWMANGIEGVLPTMADWELHLTSVFPEVRVKRYVEIRGVDCVPRPLAIACCALFEGLLYDPAALQAAMGLAEELAESGSSADRFAVACRSGLQGEVGGRPYAAWAERLVEIADAGLQRVRPGDRQWLQPLKDQVATGRSPSAQVLEAWHRDPSPEALIEALRYRP